MKVVLLHDWLTGFRGGERVLEAFCEMFPDAPLYTLLHNPGTTSSIIEDRRIETSFLNNIPGIYKHYRKFLPLFPLAASSLRITEKADLVLSSSHCVIKGVRKPLGSKHISYIHSPMRYLYDQYDSYFGPHAPLYQQLGARVFRNYLTNWDLKSNANVDFPVANAEFVRQRISKFYQIDSEVIHPFVDLDDFRSIQELAPPKEDYFLMVSAFAPNKRVDLAVKTFNRLGLPLRIIGGGQLESELKVMAKENITFLGGVSRSEVIQNMAKAKAFIFPGVEDFGITPLEAMAAGTPVIAFRKGGVLETLNEDVAIFFDDATEDGLIEALKKFEASDFSRDKLYNRANEFSKDQFKENIKRLVDKVIKG